MTNSIEPQHAVIPKRYRFIVACLVGLAAYAGSPVVSAQTTSTGSGQAYPTKPVRVIVPFAAGGGSDFIARRVSARLSENLGQQFLVDNRGGAGGMIGIEMTAKAPPDGYTLMIMSASFSASAATNKPSFDPINSIAPVIEIGSSPFVLIMHPSVPAASMMDLFALARAKPGEVIYGSSGSGGVTHLATELMASRAKIKLVHVPYKGVAPAMTDLLGGQIHFTLGAYSTAEAQLKSGRLRALSIASGQRHKLLPNVPTIAETLPGFDVELWFGVMAPAATPPAVIDRLNATLNKILQDAEMRKNLESQGMTPSGGTPQHFGARIRKDYDNWVKVVAEANIKSE
jgi:tripartite-type tricarboxylate transporter receptor subunit TctC